MVTVGISLVIEHYNTWEDTKWQNHCFSQIQPTPNCSFLRFFSEMSRSCHFKSLLFTPGKNPQKEFTKKKKVQMKLRKKKKTISKVLPHSIFQMRISTKVWICRAALFTTKGVFIFWEQKKKESQFLQLNISNSIHDYS